MIVRVSMDELVRRIRAHWERASAHADPGASETVLAAFEARHEVRLPAAFRALYRAMDGNMGDENLTRFWPLAEICRVSDVPEVADAPGESSAEASNYFVFADYMIFSHVYAVRLTTDGRDGPVWWVLGSRQQVEIAPSFEAFLRAYSENPDSILFPADIG